MDEVSSERNSDEEYYEEHQKGFNFSDSESIRRSGSSQLSSIRRNENLNDYELLQCDGLNEVAENTVSPLNLSSFSTPFKTESEQIHKSNKGVNPLDLRLKDEVPHLPSLTQAAVIRMVMGDEVHLEHFKALQDKLDLLEYAVKSHDANAILQVVLFLKQTLKKSIFQKALIKYPDAVNTYKCYLEEEPPETDEISDILLLCDRAEDAAIYKYEQAIRIRDPEKKFKALENCIRTHFQPGVVSNFLRDSVLEHKLLLMDHITLKEHQVTSNVAEDRINQLFEELTGRKFPGSSALANLIFSCLNFYKVPAIAPHSPHCVKNRFKLSSKQFAWCALRVLSAQKLWPDIPDLFHAKTWTGGIKFRTYIEMHRVLAVLSYNEAPQEVMEKFVLYIDRQELRLACAKKFKCHSIALEILKKSKDRRGLIQYVSSLPPTSAEFRSANAALQQSGVNWKN